jgi:hypothetical protein
MYTYLSTIKKTQISNEREGLICVWDSKFCKKKINKECTSGTHDFLVGIHQNFILLESVSKNKGF